MMIGGATTPYVQAAALASGMGSAEPASEPADDSTQAGVTVTISAEAQAAAAGETDPVDTSPGDGEGGIGSGVEPPPKKP